MSEPLFFRNVVIEAFRGFRDKKTIDLNASAIIVRGPNGTGKTSLFDALQWLLTGRIGRLETLPKRPNDDFITNRYRTGVPASVEAEVSLADGQVVLLRRLGAKGRPVLEWEEDSRLLVGTEAERRLEAELTPDPTVSLDTALLSSGLLQQDVMREVLEATESERYKHINSLLGLDELTKFEDAARDAASVRAEALGAAEEEVEAADGDLAEAQDELEGLRLRLRTARPVSDARNQLRDTCARVDSLISVAEPIWDKNDLSSEAEGIRLFRGLVERAIAEHEALLAGSSGIPEIDLTETEAKRDALRRAEESSSQLLEMMSNLQMREGQLSARLEALADLARVAIPLLSDYCPVCGQSIQVGDVHRRLLEQSEDPQEVERLLAEKEETEQQLSSLQEESRRLRAELSRYAEIEAARETLRAREEALAELVSDLASGARTSPVAARFLPSGGEQLRDLLQATISLEEEVIDFSLAVQASGEEPAAKQLERRIEALQMVRLEKEAVARDLRERHQRAEGLARAAKEAAVRVVDRRFSSLRPLVRDVYSRLDPHPSFKMLDFQHDFYRARGTSRPIVRDLEAGLEADPVLIFSSSQANIAALSYFLALGWAAGDRTLPFLLLDDPLQSMDDVNVLGFSDLCRFARRQRQLLISTHEDRFASLLERKLAARSSDERTRILHFVSWDRSGPQIEGLDVSPQLVERDARLVLS